MGSQYDGPITVLVTQAHSMRDVSWWQFGYNADLSVAFKLFHLDLKVRGELGNYQEINNSSNSSLLGRTVSVGYSPERGLGTYVLYNALMKVFDAGLGDEWFVHGAVERNKPCEFHNASMNTWGTILEVIPLD